MKQEKNMDQSKFYYGEEAQMLNHQNYQKMMRDILEMIQNIVIYQKKIYQELKT